MRRALFPLLFLTRAALSQCPCRASPSPCREAAASDVIFVGRVEAVTPSFLDRWNVSRRPSLRLLNEADDRYQKDPSPANLAALSATFLKLFPGLPPDRRKQLQAAATHSDLVAIFNWMLGQGRRAHIRVQTILKNGGDDDDDDKDRDDRGSRQDPADLYWDVWTPSGDCGFDFQPGETYVVYADDDESGNLLEADRCSRTSRVTDAGTDLAYLYFLKNHPAESGRLEGFVTSNVLYQKELGGSRDPARINSPVPGVVVELETGRGPRYTTSDADGKFVFDGLATGDYRLSAYTSAYPEEVEALASPRTVHVDTGTCALHVVLVSKASGGGQP